VLASLGYILAEEFFDGEEGVLMGKRATGKMEELLYFGVVD